MMAEEARYLYSTIRVVPDPANEEFATIAAIAGSDQTGDWTVRRLQNDSRAARFCGEYAVTAANDFLARLEVTIADWVDRLLGLDIVGPQEPSEQPSEEWLSNMARQRRHVVQLSSPRPILAPSAADALDMVFESMFHEPESRKRPSTKWTLLGDLRHNYLQSGLRRGQDFFWSVPLFASGTRHNYSYPIDYVVTAEEKAVQLVQMWSFRTASATDQVWKDVKAWAWVLRDLKQNGGTVERESHSLPVPDDVSVEVVLAPPEGNESEPYQEALAVFEDVNATVWKHGQEQQVAAHAAELVSAAAG
jgi:hypothetical protein